MSGNDYLAEIAHHMSAIDDVFVEPLAMQQTTRGMSTMASQSKISDEEAFESELNSMNAEDQEALLEALAEDKGASSVRREGKRASSVGEDKGAPSVGEEKVEHRHSKASRKQKKRNATLFLAELRCRIPCLQLWSPVKLLS